MKKTVVSVILLFSLLISAFAVVPQAASADALPFVDVKTGDWFYGAVGRVYKEGIIIGITAKTFEPESKMTRAQLVTITCRISGDEYKGLGEGLTFKDTPKTEWYADYVGWALREGIVNGYPDGTFKPDAPVTRAELAVVLSRFFNYREIYLADAPLVKSFADAGKIEDWAQDAVEKIRLCGIISGDPAGNFNPGASATRAEIATMITRYLDAERISKVEYLMSHYMDYLPHSGRFVTLEFSYVGTIKAEGFAKRLFPYFGITEDDYEFLVDAGEISLLRDKWATISFGDTVFETVVLTLRDKATGETSESKYIMFKLTKVEEDIYIDPDDFDPGIDGGIYSAMTETALAYTGSTARLYRALERGRSTGDLCVAFIGGSITAGSSAIYGGGYADIAANWLGRYITPDLKYVNAGIGGTDSSFGMARFERDVLSKDPDIIFIEYAVNDYPGRTWLPETFESMVRTALCAEGNPAVVIVLCRGGEGNIDQMTAVAKRYGIPIVNESGAIGYGVDNGAFTEEEFRPDGTHPEDWGHQVMSDMIEELFRRTLAEWDSVEEAEAAIVTDIQGPISPARFENLKLLEAEDLDIVSMGSFRFTGEEQGGGFSRAATSTPEGGREPIVFTVTAKTVLLVVDAGTEIMISVDGGEPFHSGSVSFMQDCWATVLSDETATHTISITPQDDSTATLLAIVYN
ncbi:MAG: S-layer homology domain-containing protein [Clostridia bacterium]|nr:S-layer homology domain-containing protein [Clostridia bacterium]